MKKTRFALLQSVIALLLCCSMLVGTTFAWFTDTVSSVENHIIAGNLDVELEWSTDFENWNRVNAQTNIFDETRWEPGHTEVVYLRVVNAGNLALQYRLGINVVEEQGSFNQAGNAFALSQFIEFGTVTPVTGKYATRDEARAALTNARKISAGFQADGSLVKPGVSDVLALVVYMPETVGNDANHATGMEAPWVKLGLNVYATQETEESDSFGKDYDSGATLPVEDLHFSVALPLASNMISDTNTLTQPMTLGAEDGEIYAEVPAEVKLAEGATALEFKVETIEESQANVTLESGEVANSIDVHVEGVAADNTTPITVSLKGAAPTGLYNSNISLYHVENGVTVPMTQVTSLGDLDEHNEFYYDADTGDIILMMASFSEVFVAYVIDNPWDGSVDTSWYNNHTQGEPYELKDAADLAGFAKIVGGMADGIERDSFAGETVELTDSIDLCDRLWYPIGYYFTDDENGDGTTGDYYCDLLPFEGTFNGYGNTIANFRQRTWDMTGDDPHYDLTQNQYYNEGMGLFGFINNGTVQNLVIYGMEAVGEFTDIGCITAYARGTCTFDSIRISDVSCYSYNCRTAGIVGYDWIGDAPSTYTFSNIEIDPTCTFGALWGSWDVACAGILGYMNDTSTANFSNCNVGPVLDVYNDVCGNYQYYQYRYSGMMIGTVGKDGDPTDMSGKINFTNCTVCFGDWSNYYYCEFVKNSLAAYTHDYQFSRVSKDEITFNSNGTITGCTHDHAAQGTETVDGNEVLVEDKTAIMIPFRQIYTGYGWGAQAEAPGIVIEVAKYTIAYVNNGRVLDVTYVTDNSQAVKVAGADSDEVDRANASMEALGYKDIKFSHWMNAGSTKVTEVPAGNTTNIVLYPSYEDLYTATFVDQQGNILDWTTFTKTQYSTLSEMIDKVAAPETDELKFDYWEVHVTNDAGETTVKEAWSDYLNDSTLGTTDISLYPIYTYNGDVNLIPIDNDGDGITDEYQVGGYSNPEGQDMVEIPDSVNGIKITSIAASAFASYAGVHSVIIPTTVTTVGGNVLATDWTSGFDKGETVTIYYAGSCDDWIEREKTFTNGWDDGLGEGSRIFFLNGGTVVDKDEGYLEASFSGYVTFGTREVNWNEKSITPNLVEEYYNTCDCDDCNGADRPDKAYWEGVTVE